MAEGIQAGTGEAEADGDGCGEGAGAMCKGSAVRVRRAACRLCVNATEQRSRWKVAGW